MSEAPVAPPAIPAAFHVERQGNKHIVDVLIEERCPSFAAHPTWPLVRPVLHAMLGYGKARRMADELSGKPGSAAFDALASQLRVSLDLRRFERLPTTGRLVVAANHPTGLADGVAMWEALRKVRSDVVFFANADALRVNPAFSDVIIPVEWVQTKRTPAKARETLRQAAEAFAQEKCIVIFPSGRLARKIDGNLREQEWFSSFLSLARKHRAPIAPIGVSARNSRLYYALSQMSGELRDITLFNELLNKTGSRFEMNCGPLIQPGAVEGDVAALTVQMRDYVSYALTGDPDAAFSPVAGAGADAVDAARP